MGLPGSGSPMDLDAQLMRSSRLLIENSKRFLLHGFSGVLDGDNFRQYRQGDFRCRGAGMSSCRQTVLRLDEYHMHLFTHVHESMTGQSGMPGND